jgi:hypothetical protein
MLLKRRPLRRLETGLPDTAGDDRLISDGATVLLYGLRYDMPLHDTRNARGAGGESLRLHFLLSLSSTFCGCGLRPAKNKNCLKRFSSLSPPRHLPDWTVDWLRAGGRMAGGRRLATYSYYNSGDLSTFAFLHPSSLRRA